MCVVNSLGAVLAVIANGLVIVAIFKTTSIRTPSNILICCLALTDLLSGLISQLAFVMDKVARLKDNADFFCVAALTTFVSGYILSGVSFLTLTAISTERLLALKLHLRYHQFVTIPRVLFVETIIWLICGFVVLLPLVGYSDVFQVVIAVLGAASLVLNFIMYCVVFRVVKKHQAKIRVDIQLAGHFHGRRAVDMRKIKHSSWTLACVCFLYFICYVPFVAIKIAENFNGNSTAVGLTLAQEMNETVILLVACVNPVVYCYRLSEIRKAVSNVLKNIWCNFKAEQRLHSVDNRVPSVPWVQPA